MYDKVKIGNLRVVSANPNGLSNVKMTKSINLQQGLTAVRCGIV